MDGIRKKGGTKYLHINLIAGWLTQAGSNCYNIVQKQCQNPSQIQSLCSLAAPDCPAENELASSHCIYTGR